MYEEDITMDKIRKKVYVRIIPESNEITFSGIEFTEFIRYIPYPLNNLLLLKGDGFGNRRVYNFELFEGQECVLSLSKEHVHDYGDFSFVDYSTSNAVNELSKEQVAELLYLGHMHSPLKSPFLEVLKNKFVYLAHDDGWYCKLYCQNINDFITVLLRKIASNFPVKNICEISDCVTERILIQARDGLLIDLDEVVSDNGSATLMLYSIGEFVDMDAIFNDVGRIKCNAARVTRLCYYKEIWLLH